MSSSYGGYYGGDPRKFFPDEEVCTPQELAAHREACDAWNQGLRPEPDGHIRKYNEEGRLILHIAKNPYGLGVTTFDDDEDDQFEEEPDLPLEEQEDEELLSVYLSNAGKDSEDAARILAERHGVDEVQEIAP